MQFKKNGYADFADKLKLTKEGELNEALSKVEAERKKNPNAKRNVGNAYLSKNEKEVQRIARRDNLYDELPSRQKQKVEKTFFEGRTPAEKANIISNNRKLKAGDIAPNAAKGNKNFVDGKAPEGLLAGTKNNLRKATAFLGGGERNIGRTFLNADQRKTMGRIGQAGIGVNSRNKGLRNLARNVQGRTITGKLARLGAVGLGTSAIIGAARGNRNEY